MNILKNISTLTTFLLHSPCLFFLHFQRCILKGIYHFGSQASFVSMSSCLSLKFIVSMILSAVRLQKSFSFLVPPKSTQRNQEIRLKTVLPFHHSIPVLIQVNVKLSQLSVHYINSSRSSSSTDTFHVFIHCFHWQEYKGGVEEFQIRIVFIYS